MEPPRSPLHRRFLLGWIAALLVLGLGLRVPALLALASGWAALLVVSWFRARRPLAGLAARRELYPSAFEGDRVDVDLVLEAARPARLLELSDAFGPSIASEERMLEPGPLAPGGRCRLTYTAWCSRQWGVHLVGPVEVASSDPAGLFTVTRVLPVVEEFAVFPRVYDVAGLAELGARPSLSPYDVSAGRSGQSPLYLGVRDWRPGDDLRRIHWPASARRGSLVSKEYEVDLAPYFTVFLDLDRRHRAGTGKKSTLEYVIRTAASVIWTASRTGGFVQVAGLGSAPLLVPPGCGEDHLTFALFELIRATLDGDTPFPEMVLQHLSIVPPWSTVVLVSGSVFLDLGATGELIEAFRGRSARTGAFLVNNFSFPAIHGWPPPRVEIVERRREVEFFLRSRGVPVRVLEEADELEAALGGAGLLP